MPYPPIGGGGGGNPAGSGTEIQYRLTGTTFGAIPNSYWDGTEVGLGEQGAFVNGTEFIRLYGAAGISKTGGFHAADGAGRNFSMWRKDAAAHLSIGTPFDETGSLVSFASTSVNVKVDTISTIPSNGAFVVGQTSGEQVGIGGGNINADGDINAINGNVNINGAAQYNNSVLNIRGNGTGTNASFTASNVEFGSGKTGNGGLYNAIRLAWQGTGGDPDVTGFEWVQSLGSHELQKTYGVHIDLTNVNDEGNSLETYRGGSFRMQVNGQGTQAHTIYGVYADGSDIGANPNSTSYGIYAKASSAAGTAFAGYFDGEVAATNAIQIGDTTKTDDGLIRWTGSDFEGRKAGAWESLTGGGGGSPAVLGKTISTGLVEGGFLSINGGDNTTFDLSAGSAYIVDKFTTPTLPNDPVLVTWTAFVGVIPEHAATFVTYIGINAAGAIVQQGTPFTPTQEKTIINIGAVVTQNTVNVDSVADGSHDSTSDYLSSDLSSALGLINVQGNTFSAAASDLTLAKSSGVTFQENNNRDTNTFDANNKANLAQDPATFNRFYNDGSGVPTIETGQTDVNTTQWDDGSGTLANIPNNDWVNIPCLFFSDVGLIALQYPEQTYANQEDALLAAPTQKFTELFEGADASAIRCIITVQEGETDLTNASFFQTSKFGHNGVGGSPAAAGLQDFQSVYNESVDPEITTDGTRGPVSYKGGTGTDTDNVLDVKNNAGTVTAEVSAEGKATLAATILGGNEVDDILLSTDTASASDTALVTAGYVDAHSGGGGGGDSSTLFNESLGTNQREFICNLSESVQRVAFSGMMKLATGLNPNIIGPFINGDTDQANYKNVTYNNTGASIAANTNDPVGGVSAGGWAPVHGYAERFPDGLFINVTWVDRDGDGIYVERHSATFYETTTPATIDSITFLAQDAGATLDAISHFRAWKDVGVGGGGGAVAGPPTRYSITGTLGTEEHSLLTASGLTMTLPAGGTDGTIKRVTNRGGGVNTLAGDGSETLDETTINDGESFLMMFDQPNTNWIRI